MGTDDFIFIAGDDDFLVQQRGQVVFDKWMADLPEGDAFSCELIEGQANNVEEVERAVRSCRQALQTPSLLGERKVVWFKGITFLADSPTGRAEATRQHWELFQKTLEGFDAKAVRLVLTAFPVDRRRKEFKWLQSKASFFYVESGGKKDAGALRKMIQEECQQYSIQLKPDALEILLAQINANARLAVEEIRKLATYLGPEGGPIDEKLVLSMVPPFGQSDFFEAAEAFYALDLAWTLEALKHYFFSYREARPLLTSLQGRNRLLIQLRGLMDAYPDFKRARTISKAMLDRMADTYAQHFGGFQEKSNLNLFTQNPWYLSRLLPVAAKLSLRQLIDFQIAFISTFEALISQPTEQESVLRALAVRCLGAMS